jgi:hypothetical protein
MLHDAGDDGHDKASGSRRSPVEERLNFNHGFCCW